MAYKITLALILMLTLAAFPVLTHKNKNQITHDATQRSPTTPSDMSPMEGIIVDDHLCRLADV